MKKVYSIGELLIDFLPNHDKNSFVAHFGGAPANVAVVVKKLGGVASFIGSLGNDYFGNYLFDAMENFDVEVKYLNRIEKNTMLAFVTLDKNGDRSFSFYRDNTADLFLSTEKIADIDFNDDILHFCSVSLINKNNIKAHKIAISKIKHKKGIISFDPNLRFNLWPDMESLKKTVIDFLMIADIIKVSEEELMILSCCDKESEAITYFLKFPIKILLVTRGAHGASAYTHTHAFHSKGFKVNVIDTTGAGDAFIGAILYQLQKEQASYDSLDNLDWHGLLEFACKVAAETTKKHGAVTSYDF